MPRSSRLFSIALVALFSLHAAVPPLADVRDLSGRLMNPFSTPSRIRVLLFARSDCPITKRYAPELRRIAQEFKYRDVDFWLVFPDRSESVPDIRSTIDQFHFPGTPVLDPKHALVRLANATVAPEAAVFDASETLIYHGRIDDRYVDVGKSKPAADVHDLENAITAALNHKPVTEPVTRAVGCSLADVE